MEDLRVAFQKLRQYQDGNGLITSLAFVPEAPLNSLLTCDVVQHALSSPVFHLEPHQRNTVTQEVIESARKVFAILTELRMEHKLKLCLENCLTDSSLPVLDDKSLSDLLPESASHFRKLQWEYVPLKLREYSHRDLGPDRILPFIETKALTTSGFSKVFKIKVHPSYQDWSSSNTTVQLVRKEICPSTSYHAQRNETDLLFLLRSLKNDNIVRLITSYTQNGVCSLLFPVADYDLHDLLLDSVVPEWIQDSNQAVDSFRGLVEGLHYLHNFSPSAKNVDEAENITKHGYHHDIKPRNILVKGSRLILADFGLSRLKDGGENTRTLWKNTPPTYAAPEACDPVTLQERPIGRAYDMWSIGCVLSEFTTFAWGRSEAVKLFRQKRAKEGIYGIDNCFHHQGKISPQASAWLRDMTEHCDNPSLTTLFGICTKLLIGNPDQRLKSQQMLHNFDRLSLQQCVQSVTARMPLLRNNENQRHTSTIYQTKLTLESNRLRCWAYAIGLETFEQQLQPWDCEVSQRYHLVYNTLSSCYRKLVGYVNQAEDTDPQQLVLALLATTNDELLVGLSKDRRQIIENSFELLTVSTANTVRLIVDSQSKLSRSRDMAGTTSGTHSTVGYHEAGLLAAARYISLMLTSHQSSAQSETVRIIDPSLIDELSDVNDSSNPLSVRWYYKGFRESDREKVLVEERSYNSQWTSALEEEEFMRVGKEVFDRVKELAMLFGMQSKPKDMRLLECVGIYHLPAIAKVGFVHAFPWNEQSQDDVEPVSLDEIIRHTKDPEHNPTLNEKFALAQAIVTCIYNLHLTGWFHKSISSSNLIYFKRATDNFGDVDIEKPYLIGLQHSRQSKIQAYSTKNVAAKATLFIHPTYQKTATTFHSAFDYYSLGVILLEIALWRTVDKMVMRTEPDMTMVRLLETNKLYTSQRMGVGYRDTVTACLTFFDNHVEEKEERVLLMRFQQDVLEKLQKTSLPV